MNLLVISNNPSRASFRQRIGIYFDSLRSNGIFPEVEKLPKSLLTRQKLFRRAADFDGVFLHKKGLNSFDAFWLSRYGKKIIYDFDDAVMYSPKAPDYDSPSHFRRFRRSVKLADLVIAGNSYLAEHARRFNSNIEILPTGLDTNSYNVEAGQAKDDKIRLVWIGSKSTLRYLAEIQPALEEIGSKFENIILRVICDDSFQLKNLKVENCPWSEETQATDLSTCDIGLASLPDNRFTRGKCGFKILQYASAGLPVVASPVGVNAEYIRQGAGFLAEGTSDWIDKISQLINDSKLRKQMGQAGKEQVQKFDLKVLGPKLVGFINRCIKGE